MLAAADPAQPYGAALPWPARPEETATSHRPGRKAGAVVVLFGGELVLYVERGGKTLLSWTDDPAVLEPCARRWPAAVRDGALGRITVEKADGGMVVHDSPLTAALEAAGFRPPPAACGCAASERGSPAGHLHTGLTVTTCNRPDRFWGHRGKFGSRGAPDGTR